jgi:hypothetical protein
MSPVSERSEESCEDKKYCHHYREHIDELIQCPIPICETNYWSDLLQMIEYDDECDESTETRDTIEFLHERIV